MESRTQGTIPEQSGLLKDPGGPVLIPGVKQVFRDSAEVNGDRAVDTRDMQARHQLGDAHYTIGGYYTGQMPRTAAGWRVARYTLTVTFSDGERRLMGIAYRKGTARP